MVRPTSLFLYVSMNKTWLFCGLLQEIIKQLKPGHYPVKQKARPIPLHLQEAVRKEIEKLPKSGQLEIVRQVDEDCSVSPVKYDKLVKSSFRFHGD